MEASPFFCGGVTGWFTLLHATFQLVLTLFIAALMVGGSSTPAASEDQPRRALQGQTIKVEETQVTAERERVRGYVARDATTATKTDASLIETPQSVSVITRAQMEAQNVQSVPQALRYSSGVVAEQRGINTESLEYVYSRGFQIDEYLNGLRLPSINAWGSMIVRMA